MNRWQVYEWLKKQYMAFGKPPSIHAVFLVFFDADETEVFEGITEFEMATKTKLQGHERDVKICTG